MGSLDVDRAECGSAAQQSSELEAHSAARTVESADPLAHSDAWWRRAAMVVLGLAAILFFARLGVRALWSSEFRWGEISREMHLTGNYFWPTINGRSYFDKPLGSYWLILGVGWIIGAVNETAARAPSAFAGLLSIALLIVIARRLYDLRTGVISALILSTSFSFVFFSRNASADVETIAGELAALALFLAHENDAGGGWWVIGLWLIMAVTSQMKGLLGFVLPLVMIGSYRSLANGWAEAIRGLGSGSLGARWRWVVERHRWFFNWTTPVAIALAGAVYYAPFAISQHRTGSEHGIYMVYRENVERYFAPFDHRGPIYLYLYVIFALMAPWSAMLPAALAHTHHRRKIGADLAVQDRFALTFFWATFLFFTLSGSRRSYYILPILPPAAILVARVMLAAPERMTPLVRRLVTFGFVVVIAMVAIAALAFIPPHLFMPYPYSALPPAPDRGIYAIFWIGSVAAILWALRDLRPPRIAWAVGAIAWLFMFYFYVIAMPAGDAYRTEKPFAYRIRALIGADTPGLAFYLNQGPVYYLGLPKPTPEYDRLADLDRAIANGKVRWLVVRRRELPKLNFPYRQVTAETAYPWDPKQHRLNAMVLLQVEPSAAAPPQK
jgi:4-amino-4-deoxy-L-arabinose transferase-like glycosyltransferase